MDKIKFIFSSLLISLCMMSNAKALTIDFVDDALPHLFGDPLDWQNLNGAFRFSPDRNLFFHYNSDDLAAVIPENRVANLTVVWKKRRHNGHGFRTIGNYALTDGVGGIIKEAFWVTLVCHREYIIRITSNWISDDDVIPNPLPPSVIAFLSAMAGIGFMVRRRRSKTI